MIPSKSTIIALIKSGNRLDLELARDMINELLCQAVIKADTKTDNMTNLPF
jgi:hypothetical protein